MILLILLLLLFELPPRSIFRINRLNGQPWKHVRETFMSESNAAGALSSINQIYFNVQ